MRDQRAAFLRKVRRRVRSAWFVATVQIVLPWLAGAALLLVALGRLIDIPVALSLVVLAAVSLVGAMVGAVFLGIDDWGAARIAERSLGLDDLLSTSLEFDRPDVAFDVEIQHRASDAISAADTRRLVALPVDLGRLRTSAVVGSLALALAVLPGLSTPQSPAVTEAITAEAERIEDIADAVEVADVDGGEEIADELRRLAEELRSAETMAEALDALDESERRLSAQVDSDFLSEKAAAQGLARDLTLRPLVSDGPPDAAGQLDALAASLGELSEPELRALEDRLADLAASQASGNPALASALSGAASSLASGDLSAASDAMSAAADQQRSGLGSARGQQALSETLRALDGSITRLAAGGQTAQAAGEGSGSGGQGQGDGAGGGAGQGSGSGQGSGGGTATGGGGSGTISGVSPGDGGAAGQGGAGAPGAGSSQEGTSEVRAGRVFDPSGSASVSDQIQVGIGGGTGEGAVLGRADAPTERGDSIVPYSEVLPSYLSEAADALDSLTLPPSMRDIVRTYFDRLAVEAS